MNVLGLVLQLFVVSRVVKYLGVGSAVMILPVISLGGYLVLVFVPVLLAVLAAKVLENSTDYSLNNTVRNMLFLPCTREEKYSAKQVIDSLFVRCGDLFSAALVLVGTTIIGLDALGFARVNIVLAAVGLAMAVVVGRMYAQRSGQPARSQPALGEHAVV